MKIETNRCDLTKSYGESCSSFRQKCREKKLKGAFFDRLSFYPKSCVWGILGLFERIPKEADRRKEKKRLEETLLGVNGEIDVLLELFPNDIRAEEWKQAKKIIDDYFSKQ